MGRRDEKESSVPERPGRPGPVSALLREVFEAAAEGRAGREPAAARVDVVGRFELVRELGRGGFGVVYEARDPQLNRSVALKILPPGARPWDGAERLLREAEATARLSHPNVVTIHEAGRCERGAYLVMELLEGCTLAARLEAGPLSPPEALRVGAEAARGLAHAHAHGIVHRDLTPANVFLCRDGRVKVLDLGLALLVGSRKPRGGTPAYMAPEQWRDAPEDERTDVFALGVILYRMLTGELPFEEPGRFTPTPRRLDVPGFPSLGTSVAWMLERDPVKRPRDADEVVAALTCCLGDAPATPPGERAGARRRKRSHAGSDDDRVRRTPPHSVAVLPFVNMSADAEQEYFSDGLSEEVLSALTRVSGLRVTGRTSSFAFKGRNEPARLIGETLGVRALLEGSVRKAGGRVRITARLVRAADGYHLWSQTFDREIGDIFAVQDEIARAVVDALRVELLRGRALRPRGGITPNPAAYNQFLLGRHFFNRGNLEGFRLAVNAFERALALDPSYAPAQAALAPAVLWLSQVSATTLAEILDGQRRATEAAEIAVALAPDLADGYAARGMVRTHAVWDWAGARSDLDRALALQPGDAPTQLGRAHLDAVLGRLPEAIARTREAALLDPLATDAWTHLGSYHNAVGELALAGEALGRALGIAPEHFIALEELGVNHLLAGDPASALDVFARSAQPFRALLGTALAQHDLGRAAEAQRALDEIVVRWAYSGAYQIAEVHAWRGELDAAFEWLERSREQRDPGLRRIRYDPRLRRLREDARYMAMLRTLELPVE